MALRSLPTLGPLPVVSPAFEAFPSSDQATLPCLLDPSLDIIFPEQSSLNILKHSLMSYFFAFHKPSSLSAISFFYILLHLSIVCFCLVECKLPGWMRAGAISVFPAFGAFIMGTVKSTDERHTSRKTWGWDSGHIWAQSFPIQMSSEAMGSEDEN